ncbi:undecaprenyl-phosphate glucose phosphotransferase [Halomonas sp. ANAO-440]|uniref:undecaprenyl-phosphate glucose phosphotransferase n=1 Tax=Halomonas sp. ANAO-440 TaxID=2861360 RepID=UPI001CAA4C98|nr:undecaprenyl-phosphate glucose phosphotransferase [Halomonas sp. ANAO-440]MBZ0329369.1 undecaprenyl-phosphate glucose phosphotransferase [Halomonas sp. ANAO-440]
MSLHGSSTSSDWMRRALRTFDAGIAFLVSIIVMWWLPELDHTDSIEYPLLILAGSLLLPACGELLGLYQPWRGRSLFSMLGAYVLGWLLTIALLSLFLVITQSAGIYSRLWMGSSALAVLACGIVLRTALYLFLRRLRSRGRNIKRVLLIGPECYAARIERKLSAMPYVGYRVTRQLIGSGDPAFLDQTRQLARQSIFERDFDEVWLSYPLAEGETVREVANAFMSVPVSLRYFPDLSDVRLLNHRAAQVASMYSLVLNYSPLDGPRRLVKAIEDRVLGLVLFILFLPLMLTIAGVIRWKMGSPVLFKQERHGLDGKIFRIYKFRTMIVHEETGTPPAQHNDPRTTKLGAWLRRTSLDELPQLYNVLQGRMSLVGPRPHAMDHNAYYNDLIESYMQRHRVKPGMTGWAQVHGLRGITGDVDMMRKRVEYDLFYIDHWSLGFDLKILAMTVTRGFINNQP